MVAPVAADRTLLAGSFSFSCPNLCTPQWRSHQITRGAAMTLTWILKGEVWRVNSKADNTVTRGVPVLLHVVPNTLPWRKMNCHLSVSYSVHNPGNHAIHLHRFELLPKQEGLDGVESTREIKRHHSHPASQLRQVGIRPVELVYDSIVRIFAS